MARPKASDATLAVIVLLTAVSVGYRLVMEQRPGYTGLARGNLFDWPLTYVAPSMSRPSGRCRQVFIGVTSCAACRSLIANRDTLDYPPDVVLFQGIEGLQDVLKELEADPRGIAAISRFDSRLADSVDLWGTPVRLVLDEDGVIRDLAITAKIASGESVDRDCAAGPSRMNQDLRLPEPTRTIPSPWVNDLLRATLATVSRPLWQGRYILDAQVLARDQVAVLGADESGEKALWIVDTRTGMSTKADVLPPAALDLVDLPENLGVWSPLENALWLYDRTSLALVEAKAPFLPEGLLLDVELGASGPLLPPRDHGRMGVLAGDPIVELRPRNLQDDGQTSPAHLARINIRSAMVDTLFTFPAATYGVGEGTSRRCCGFAPVFASQPSWLVNADQTIVISASGQSGMTHLDSLGGIMETVAWPALRRRITSEDALAHFETYVLGYESFDEPDSVKAQSRAGFLHRIDRNMKFFNMTLPDNAGVVPGPGGSFWVRSSDRSRPFGLGEVIVEVRPGGDSPTAVRLPRLHVPFGTDVSGRILGSRLSGMMMELVWYCTALASEPCREANRGS